MEEGDYSAWTVYHDLQDDELVGASLYDAFTLFDEDSLKALFVYMGVFCKPYDVATKTLSSSILTPAYFGGANVPFQQSAYRTYAVFVDTDEDEIHICKDGALAESHTVAALGHSGFDVVGVAISPDGQYVVAALQKGSPTYEGYWVVLKGS